MSGVAHKAGLILAGIALAMTACGTGTPPPSGTPTPTRSAALAPSASAPAESHADPTPTASAVASPTPPPTDRATVFGADGIGPYIVDTPMTELLGRALITNLSGSTTCSGATAASATAGYANVISLSFVAGQLESVHTTSDTLVTPSGVKVGTPFSEAQTLFGGRAEIITAASGAKALLVPVIATPLALVLYLDPTNTKVASMSGGDAARLTASARAGEAC